MLRIWIPLLLTCLALPASPTDDDASEPLADQTCASDSVPRTAPLFTFVLYGSYETEADALTAWDDPAVLSELYRRLGDTVFWGKKCAECAQPTASPRCPRSFHYLNYHFGDLEIATVKLPDGSWTLRIKVTGAVDVVMRCKMCVPIAS